VQELLLSWLDSHTLFAFLGAFGVGALTAAAPCSLVSVPLLVASSLSLNQNLEGSKKVFYTYAFALLFALGVMISFSILGFIVAKMGGFFSIAPLWTYGVAALFSLVIALYALGFLGEVDKSRIIERLLKYRLVGGLIIGLVFGLVSTPCASAPLFAIITTASQSGYFYAYGLILTFAFGHSILLLAAALSVGFTQKVISSRHITQLSNWLNRFFAVVLLGFTLYFSYAAYQQL